MPRKTNGFPFEVHRSPSTDDEGGVVLYATPLSNRTMEFDELDGYLILTNAVRKGELQRSFDAFLEECVKWISQGYRVETPLGVFSPKLGMKRKVTNTREVRHNDVEFKSIDFRSSAKFTEEVKYRIAGYRYVQKADSTLLMVNDEFMEKALRKSIHAEGNYTTVSTFMFYSGLSKYAATKKLRQWCASDHPRLKQRRIGHSIIYELIEMDE